MMLAGIKHATHLMFPRIYGSRKPFTAYLAEHFNTNVSSEFEKDCNCFYAYDKGASDVLDDERDCSHRIYRSPQSHTCVGRIYWSTTKIE